MCSFGGIGLVAEAMRFVSSDQLANRIGKDAEQSLIEWMFNMVLLTAVGIG